MVSRSKDKTPKLSAPPETGDEALDSWLSGLHQSWQVRNNETSNDDDSFITNADLVKLGIIQKPGGNTGTRDPLLEDGVTARDDNTINNEAVRTYASPPRIVAVQEHKETTEDFTDPSSWTSTNTPLEEYFKGNKVLITACQQFGIVAGTLNLSGGGTQGSVDYLINHRLVKTVDGTKTVLYTGPSDDLKFNVWNPAPSPPIDEQERIFSTFSCTFLDNAPTGYHSRGGGTEKIQGRHITYDIEIHVSATFSGITVSTDHLVRVYEQNIVALDLYNQ